jgi:hypothetical protein
MTHAGDQARRVHARSRPSGTRPWLTHGTYVHLYVHMHACNYQPTCGLGGPRQVLGDGRGPAAHVQAGALQQRHWGAVRAQDLGVGGQGGARGLGAGSTGGGGGVAARQQQRACRARSKRGATCGDGRARGWAAGSAQRLAAGSRAEPDVYMPACLHALCIARATQRRTPESQLSGRRPVLLVAHPPC